MFSLGYLDRGVTSGIEPYLVVGREPLVRVTLGALGWHTLEKPNTP